jgi:PTH1 family peptidyl-tRNA hydrolase
MNRSGQSVAAIANFFKIEPEQILVAHDELDLGPGIAKLKKGGGHGGHNGLRDIISSLGNKKNFIRLRIGIGHPGSAKQVSNYVLSRPSSDDRIGIDQSIERTLQCIESIASGDLDQAMLKLHTQN